MIWISFHFHITKETVCYIYNDDKAFSIFVVIPYSSIMICSILSKYAWYTAHSWPVRVRYELSCASSDITQIARFMGPTWGPPGSCRPQMGPMVSPWTLLSGSHYCAVCDSMLECVILGPNCTTILLGLAFFYLFVLWETATVTHESENVKLIISFN